MRIETEAKDEGLNGGREVWVHVLANEAHDWPDIESKLGRDQLVMLNSLGTRTMRYFPHLPTAEEKAEHGYLFDEWFVWSAK